MRKFVTISYPPVPRVSFGGPVVNNYHKTNRYPTRSSLTGLIGNGMGVSRHETEVLEEIQDRLLWAYRLDYLANVEPEFQTADLTKMVDAWDPEGGKFKRQSSVDKHTMTKEYCHACAFSLALGLECADEEELDALYNAFRFPQNTLYMGRRACVLPMPDLLDVVEAEWPQDVLDDWPITCDYARPPLRVYYEAMDEEDTEFYHRGIKDWSADLHVGRLAMSTQMVAPPQQ